MTPRLKLRAVDAEDLAVIAACLQDAIVPVAEIGYLPQERRFVMVVNRFKWESADRPRPPDPGPSHDDEAPYERTICALRFEGVTGVRCRNLDLSQRQRLLSLLTLSVSADGLELVFAGHVELRLTASPWLCCIEDLGEPWPTSRRPHHDQAQPALSASGD